MRTVYAQWINGQKGTNKDNNTDRQEKETISKTKKDNEPLIQPVTQS